MERWLVVGDCHLKVSKLEESKELVEKLSNEMIDGHYDRLIMLGDLFDTFAVIRSEILSLWTNFFVKTNTKFGKDNVIVLVGNHDMAGLNGGTNALEPFNHLVTVVSELTSLTIDGQKVHFLPFMRDNKEFETICQSLLKDSILFCHQSFNGAKFETGYYDPHGANPDCVKHLKRVIPGHIHLAQSFENIWYPGTPMQHTFGEAGQKKAIFYMSISKTGIEMKKAIELDMPTFEVIEAKEIKDIILPPPNPRTSYKIISKGTPQEIVEFWKSNEVKDFKLKAKRVVDALTPVKGEDFNQIISNANTTEDKLTLFIESRNWRSDKETLIENARRYLS